ncbi:MAG: DUF1501 domain-containing protein [Cytophagales bacterium]|nr:MAG: DUF1501 domain-containing protein [Cytophagales bacterium]
MKRREFLRSMPAFATPFMLGGIPMTALSKSNLLTQMAAAATNDKVIVLIQLHGGNDGLNTLVPIEEYTTYYNMRQNIAIPDKGTRKFINLDSTLDKSKQVGLHPDMGGFKALYDQSKVAIVQNVAYQNLNMSHFRGRDIWHTGSDANEYLGSGWMGRYLDETFPGYPKAYPTAEQPDPLAIELGRDVSLAFHNGSIPMSISIDNPDQFFNLINEVKNSDLPPELKDTYYNFELDYISQMEQKSNQYAGRLKQVFDKGQNTASVVYPSKYPLNAPKGFLDNELAPQLRLIARLLSGGCKTKVFLARLTGFDNHDFQVEKTDTTLGAHAALLFHLSSAMKAFQDDLKGLGIDNRVLTATFSEFGRTPRSNESYGTDHGAAAPMFIFGSCVKPGIIGNSPELKNLDGGGNLRHQYDYRQVFTGMLKNWFEASDEVINNKVLFSEFNNSTMMLDVVTLCNSVGVDDFFNTRFKLFECFPNPVKSNAVIKYYINSDADVKLSLIDINGILVKQLVNTHQVAGEYQVQCNVDELKPGTYVYKIEAGLLRASKKMVVIK